ncbi:hypothetical protein M378DRAFT_187070 [Amanita muscaria Koide BX008]|uniref:Thioesterase domain-containing protein n=1 Tax=Amanita muscaria (strain Koide BX008) TaxID=946122 RepID=A0A0C2SJ19_AMAMK|nr:hypothetical protein M378DRAFT_187070 [Amanita muscaria Koide BX008]
MAACLRFTRRVWDSFLVIQGHDARCVPNLVIHRAIPGTVEASLKVEPYNLNRVGVLHGGLVLSLTDALGSLAVASKGFWMTGVTTDLGTSFVRPAGRVGDVLHVRAVLTGIGKSLAYTRVDFMSPRGELVAYGYHTKYVGKSSSHANNVILSEDGETVMEGVGADVN